MKKISETKNELFYNKDKDDLRATFSRLTKSVTIFKGQHFIDLSFDDLRELEKIALEIEQEKWPDIDDQIG